MPFALLIIGVWLLIAGVRDTAGPATQPGTLFYLLHGDFTGPNNFIYWFLAIVLIGALGYIPRLKPLSTAFLALVLVVLFLKKGNASGVGGGFFGQFLSGIGVSQTATGTSPQTAIAGIQGQIATNTAAQQTTLDSLSGNVAALDAILKKAGA